MLEWAGYPSGMNYSGSSNLRTDIWAIWNRNSTWTKNRLHSGSESAANCRPFWFWIYYLVTNCRPFWFWICQPTADLFLFSFYPLGFSESVNCCRPFWFWSWWPTAEHSGSESAANRTPFWLWIYYLGKWKKEEGRRRDGGGCSTVVNRLSVPRPLARRASHLRLPTSTRSPLLLTLCLAHFSRSLDPQPPRHFRSLLPLYRTHFRSHTHPPTTSNPPYPTSQYIFLSNLSIYLSIYLSMPFCCPELVLNPPADNSPFSKNQNPPSNQQALMNCFCFQNHIAKLSLHYYCLA
jgi:hypothetical protein